MPSSRAPACARADDDVHRRHARLDAASSSDRRPRCTRLARFAERRISPCWTGSSICHRRALHRRADRRRQGDPRRAAAARVGRRAARPLPRGARARASTSSSRSSIASPTGTTCARSRSTCRAQICITRDNTQLQVDGILYFQVTDPKLASYGSSNYVLAITQLAQTTLRSVIGRMELDKTFEERDQINAPVVAALDAGGGEAGASRCCATRSRT